MQHGRFKTQARSSAWLKKKVSQEFSRDTRPEKMMDQQ
jgi:hypothetical protein